MYRLVASFNARLFPPVTHLEVIHTEGCNLGCAYCFEKEMLGYRRMPPAVAGCAVRLILLPPLFLAAALPMLAYLAYAATATLGAYHARSAMAELDEAKKLLDSMKPGEVLHLVSSCPGSPDDVRAWTRSTGLELLAKRDSARGVHGQVIYVDPASRLVLVQTAVRRQIGDPNLETLVRQKAEEEILKAALEDGILEQAKTNAEAYLFKFFSALGFPNTIFVEDPN